MQTADSSFSIVNLSWIFVMVLAGATLCGLASAAETAPKLTPVDRFNYGLGTQTFAPRYHFTEKTRLVETAEAILAMGSNVLKCDLSRKVFDDGMYGLPQNADIHTMKDLLEKDPSFQRVLAMPFAYYLFWAYPHSVPDSLGHAWRDGLSVIEKESEYKEVYDLTQFLLRKFNRSGKTFYLGHWEGDWTLLGSFEMNKDPEPVAVQGMIDWLNVRQQAVEDAKRDTRHKDVDVFQYTEVNLVRKAIKGEHCLTNDVLPKTNVDYVSYSSYDSLDWSQGLPAMAKRVQESLTYIESKLPEKKITGKRVFIGEYGFPLVHMKTPQAQDEAARVLATAALEWGCPFVLYWEIYCNEADPVTGKLRGFWMIDDQGVRQPVYDSHQQFLSRGRAFVVDYRRKHHADPPARVYQDAAVQWLAK